MAAIPIWKDKLVTLSSSSAIEFRITMNGTVIYTGKATKRPGAASIVAKINEICADYLSSVLPTRTDRAWTGMSLPSFAVQTKSGSTWSTQETVQFYPNWSYDYGFSGNNLSFPINGRLDRGMWLFASVLAKATPLNATYRISSGSSSTRAVTISPSPGTGTGVWKVSAVANTVRITVNGNEYSVVTNCAKFALYYVNAYGGWDQFLIEGNDMEVDSLERFIREQEYDNNSILNAGKVNYVNDITKSWTLNSGWMSNDAGLRMHHLLNSCLVYLFDIATGDFIPVTISTNSCEYKTRKNQGRSMVNYSFTVTLAQNRIRR